MDDIITMAHGAGGTATRHLIESIFKSAFGQLLTVCDDAAVLPKIDSRIAVTTDGFIVYPQFFRGGDIGKLSVCGTVNDLACMGAKPLYMTCSFIIEEGCKIADIKKIADSMAETAKKTGVRIVAGDTKVAEKGHCGGVFITTTGIGELAVSGIGGANACDKDAVIVTGDIGRHGTAILLSRNEFGIDADIESDCAPLWDMVKDMIECGEIHTIRDATRGGVGTVLNEVAEESGLQINIFEKSIPVCDGVKGVCGMLGLDPIYMACEGRMVVFVPQKDAEKVLKAIRSHEAGKNASVIGIATKSARPCVAVETEAGGTRLLPPPSGELLPRIC